MDDTHCEHHAPTPGLELVKGVLSHVAAAGRNKDHVVAAVDVRRAYFFAEPLPKTFVELPDVEVFLPSFHAGSWWESCMATTFCSQDPDHLLMQHRSLYGRSMRHEN